MDDSPNNFLDYFSDISDPRSTRNQVYSCEEILLLTLCAVICGAEGWQDVEDFGHAKLDFLQEQLPYIDGIPSDDTVRRFFRAIDPKTFEDCFVRWVQSLQRSLSTPVIAIDGKTSRHSFDDDQAPLHMVSAFASEARLVLGQQKVAEKSNEITAIPDLLKILDLKGSIVTIDAMGCQYKIADDIIARDGDYVLALKGNQSSMHTDVKAIFEDPEMMASYSPSFYEETNKGHGRLEHRKCWVVADVERLKARNKKWKSVKSVIRIESTREIKDKKTAESRYYISSLPSGAKKILNAVRSHWAIENSLHWVLDMSFGDDQSRIRKQNAPEVMAVFRHIALNLLQKYKKKRQSIKRLRKMAGWENRILREVLQQKSS